LFLLYFFWIFQYEKVGVMAYLLIAFGDKLVVKTFFKINNLGDSFFNELELVLIVVFSFFLLIFTDLNAAHR
jgi:hypothetical protein